MDNKPLIGILKKMILIRRFEEKVAELAEKQEIITPVHLYVGQEAIAAAICENLSAEDFVYSTHRSHGHYLAKGGNVQKLMSEIYCRQDGCSGGKGGSMHIIDRNVHYMLSSPIVGGSIPIAVGSAFAAQYSQSKQVSVAFFGDGATDEGVFYESINFAALYKLPMIFICENNSFSTHLPDFLRQSNTEVSQRIKGFNLATAKINGNDPVEIYKISKQYIDRARENNGPVLLECITYRWLSHVGYWADLDVGFRKKADVEYWMQKCPIKSLSEYLVAEGVLNYSDIEKIDYHFKSEIIQSVEIARSSNKPDPQTLFNGL